ncbi:hypothetical protein EJ110_NYTH56794 [Nymphaea thermarum]|nr:hypothetical protein EJ110_NYTH56794 [Nymphaea thermarum]
MATNSSPFPGLPAPTSFQHFISTKLDYDNYVLWASQFRPLLISYDLEGFIDGSKTEPQKTIIKDGKSAPNLEYIDWRRRDQLLLCWLISSLSDSVHSQKARSIAHHLKAAGKKVEEEDLILHILCGLPPEYEAMRHTLVKIILLKKHPTHKLKLMSLTEPTKVAEINIMEGKTIVEAVVVDFAHEAEDE